MQWQKRQGRRTTDEPPADQSMTTASVSSSAVPRRRLKVLEFFSGIGGMRVALKEAIRGSDMAIESCQAYDISLYANQTYAHNFSSSSDDHKPITKLVEQLKSVPAADLWTMSPPCQPFTSKGNRKDSEDKRCNGLKGLIKLLNADGGGLEEEQKPTYMLLENVAPFATSDMCILWKNCLKQNGYSYKEYLLSPMDVGIPNHRLRYYMLVEKGTNRWGIPPEAHQHEEICKIPPGVDPLQEQVKNRRTLSYYLRDSVQFKQQSPELYESLLVPMEVLEQPWATQLGVVSQHDTHSHCFTAGYGRLYHAASGSLLLEDYGTALSENPIDRSDMVAYHGKLRRLAPSELLHLFGFPSTYEFPPRLTSLEQQYKLIGNSINVTVVSMLLKELLLADA